MTREEKRAQQLRDKLQAIGPMLPGSISEQWNVCGTPGCRCKNVKNPVKHGPYYQLSYTVSGRSSTIFIKKEDLAEAKRRLKCHAQFKAMCKEVVQADVEVCRKTGLNRSHP